MTTPVTKTETLVTEDGVPIDAVHIVGDSRLVFVLAHGFTLNWQRPSVWKVVRRLNRFGGVVTFDFRGLGYERIVTVGFSMGASIVLRHAGLLGGEDAVVAVSCPGRWYYRGTFAMRRLHWVVEHRVGRMIAKKFMNTRISNGRWDPIPVPPADAAAKIAPTPLLIVHGDKDEYFPTEHAERLFEAANQPKELWIVPGFGHAETCCEPALLDRIGKWAVATVIVDIAPDVVA